MVQLSVVVPVFDDAQALRQLLPQLSGVDEIIVVDGGSRDASVEVARQAQVKVLIEAANRGRQLAAGAEVAHGEVIWFLHCDSAIDGNAAAMLRDQAGNWGRFRLRFDTPAAAGRVVAFFMEWRSRLTGICTGDQGIWVRREHLQAIGGVPPQPLMEDIELSRRLKRQVGMPHVVNAGVQTSARRWQANGWIRTILLMWRIRAAYFFGRSADDLARVYYS